jgi:transposase-like protein
MELRSSSNGLQMLPMAEYCLRFVPLDTIKLIAYRAETALAQLAREKMHRLDDARSLIRQLFHTEVDLIPDQQSKTLTVRLHPLTAEVHDEVVRYLCEELTSTETVFPSTDWVFLG